MSNDKPNSPALCEATYHAAQISGTVIIYAEGVHGTTGYQVFFEQSPIRIFPPQFSLWHVEPTGIVGPGSTPFEAQVSFAAAEIVEHVTVHDANGAHEVRVEQVPEPELFELSGEEIQITYRVTRTGGLVHYRDPERNLSFSEEDTRILHLEIGTLVHVLLESSSARNVMLDLLLPDIMRINEQEGKEISFETLAILTTIQGGIVPPHLMPGPVQSYRAVQLQGRARIVQAGNLPTAIFKRWVHSHEEDTEDVRVYRPSTFDFPPSWPRPGFEIKENGAFIEYVPAPDDQGVVQGRIGRWEAEDTERIRIDLESEGPRSFMLTIVSVDEQMLQIKKE